ncbi:hypothetical protein BKA82DRAFT_4185644 [Pisolithus tinctorius]|nr:hypothetical protein BKA82DRAFT_4185644 [Pisolithus tinctorius]
MSSRPARSHWKKPYNTSLKSAHSPVVAFVLAEPKQASPLHSATTKLPSILRIPMKPGVNEAVVDTVEQPPVSEESAQSESVCQGLSPGRSDVDVAAETAAGTSDVQGSDAEGISAPAQDADPSVAAAPPPLQSGASDRTISNKRSWFSPFTWLQGQESEAKLEQAPEASSALPVCIDPSELPPTLGSTVSSTSQEPSPSNATTTPHGGDSHSKEPAPQLEDKSLSQPKPDLGNSSADVSKLPPNKAQTIPLTTLQPAGVSGSTASLNSGRFTLGISLLSRSKPPLDIATGASHSENVQDVPKNHGETPAQETHRTGKSRKADSFICLSIRSCRNPY